MLKAGRYFIGDPCYALTDDVYEKLYLPLVLDGQDVLDGEFNFPDGTRFAVFATRWGDGKYYDQYYNAYAVESGCIGAIPWNYVRDDVKEKLENGTAWKGIGRFHDFDKPFAAVCDFDRCNQFDGQGGTLTFGGFEINFYPEDDGGDF